MLGNLLGGFIVILIGTNLIGSVADSVWTSRYDNQSGATKDSRVTGAAGTILGLTPLFFALGIMAAGVALCIGGLRNAGVM
jgi:hypothetical protein